MQGAIKMNDCTKSNCPLVNPSECMLTTECPFYTNETKEIIGKTIVIADSESILSFKHRGAIDVLQEIKNQLGEKYISRDEVLKLIDEKIKEYSE